jgi:hypothetical protein
MTARTRLPRRQAPAVRPRRGLALGAGAVAAAAVVGAIDLASGTDPYFRLLTDRLPRHSPVLGAVALTAVVAVPFTDVARRAWTADPHTDQAATAAGVLMLTWVAAEHLVVRELGTLDPVYAAIGAAFVAAGRGAFSGRRRAG